MGRRVDNNQTINTMANFTDILLANGYKPYTHETQPTVVLWSLVPLHAENGFKLITFTA